MGKEGWFTVYFMVTSRLKDSSIYQGFTTSTLKCPTVNIFFYTKAELKSHLEILNIPCSFFFFSGTNLYFSNIYYYFCIIVFTLLSFCIFVQCECSTFICDCMETFRTAKRVIINRHKTRRRGRRRGR